MMNGGILLNLLNSTLHPNIFQNEVSDLFVVAQTLIGFSTLGFVILLTILGLLPTLYRIQTGPEPEIHKIVKLMTNPPFRILNRFNDSRTIHLLSFSSLILIVSGVFGFIYFLYQNVIYLVIGCVISIGIISLIIIFIAYLFYDLYQNSYYYKKNKLDKIVEYIKENSEE